MKQVTTSHFKQRMVAQQIDPIMTPVLSQPAALAVADATVSRGSNYGALKKKMPPLHTNAAAAWNAIKLWSDPHRVSMWGMLSMNDEQRQIFDEVEALCKRIDANLERMRTAKQTQP